jgi:transcriptional regulator with XRE-family HTH domain
MEKQMRLQLGLQLKKAREAKGLSQENVTRLLGIGERAVSAMEGGRDGGLPLLLLLMNLYQLEFADNIFKPKPDADAESPRVIERKKS